MMEMKIGQDEEEEKLIARGDSSHVLWVWSVSRLSSSHLLILIIKRMYLFTRETRLENGQGRNQIQKNINSLTLRPHQHDVHSSSILKREDPPHHHRFHLPLSSSSPIAYVSYITIESLFYHHPFRSSSSDSHESAFFLSRNEWRKFTFLHSSIDRVLQFTCRSSFRPLHSLSKDSFTLSSGPSSLLDPMIWVKGLAFSFF